MARIGQGFPGRMADVAVAAVIHAVDPSDPNTMGCACACGRCRAGDCHARKSDPSEDSPACAGCGALFVHKPDCGRRSGRRSVVLPFDVFCDALHFVDAAGADGLAETLVACAAESGYELRR